MSLRIRHLRLVSESLKGTYEANFDFPDGLVLLHVANTSGKSTALKSIVYALGLERMFGPANHPPLTPAMTSSIKDDSDAKAEEFPVSESFVWLEIENHEERRLTLRRRVKGEGAPDWKLIEVWEGSVTDTDGRNVQSTKYYVRDGGSATREQGFYPFLAKFIGWELPDVVRFDGPPCPLYMECLLPMFFIEQSHGWTAIQATTPKYFQIRQVEKKALEFMLALDSASRDTERLRLEKEETEVKNLWSRARNLLEGEARALGGAIRNFPQEPAQAWPPENEPFMEIFHGGSTLKLLSALEDAQQRLATLEEEIIPATTEAEQEAEAALNIATSELALAESYSAELREDILLEQSNLTAIDTRLAALAEDLERNKGAEKIHKLSGVQGLAVADGKCRTCHQPIHDSLLSQETGPDVMTIEENISYLTSQHQTLEKMRGRMTNSLDALSRKQQAVIAYANELRGRIRSLKRTLLSATGTPSEAAIRERLLEEERVARFSAAVQKLTDAGRDFTSLSGRWNQLEEQRKKLKSQAMSEDDIGKINALERLFIELLGVAGFKSFAPEKFSIARDSLRPMREGFDIVYDVSASDNVRSIASFVTALLELSRKAKTNHPGLLILDELRQQNLDEGNLESIFERLALSKQAGQQVIVATSDRRERIQHFANRTDCTIIEIDGWILKRVQAQ